MSHPVDHDSDCAIPDLLAPTLTQGPLDERLQALHQSTLSVGESMRSLVPFPESIQSVPDATIVSVDVDVSAAGAVEAKVIYTTDASLTEIGQLYATTFRAAGVHLDDPIAANDVAVVMGRGTADGSSARCKVAACELINERQVCIEVSYRGYDPTTLFAQAAAWHQGAAPVDERAPDGFEIKTFLNGNQPSFFALYTTKYRFENQLVAEVRPTIEQHLTRSGWTWLEPKEGMLFLAGPFDAETHLTQDGDDAVVSFVGEFEVSK